MSFSPPVVGLLKIAYKGGRGGMGTPGPPLASPLNILQHTSVMQSVAGIYLLGNFRFEYDYEI